MCGFPLINYGESNATASCQVKARIEALVVPVQKKPAAQGRRWYSGPAETRPLSDLLAEVIGVAQAELTGVIAQLHQNVVAYVKARLVVALVECIAAIGR